MNHPEHDATLADTLGSQRLARLQAFGAIRGLGTADSAAEAIDVYLNLLEAGMARAIGEMSA
jgi:hypothetical protein